MWCDIFSRLNKLSEIIDEHSERLNILSELVDRHSVLTVQNGRSISLLACGDLQDSEDRKDGDLVDS